MKQPSELRADNRAATHRNLHCRHSGFRSALYATFPRVVSNPKPLPTRQMRPSRVRQTSDVLGELSTRGTLGDVRLSKCRFKVEMSDSLSGWNHPFSGSHHGVGLEATV